MSPHICCVLSYYPLIIIFFLKAKETPEMVSLEVSLEEHNSCPNERFPHNNLRSFAEMTRQAVNSKGKFVPPACNIGSNQKQQTVTERVTEKLIQSLRISRYGVCVCIFTWVLHTFFFSHFKKCFVMTREL